MATMVKEKRREKKKKTRDVPVPNSLMELESSSPANSQNSNKNKSTFPVVEEEPGTHLSESNIVGNTLICKENISELQSRQHSAMLVEQNPQCCSKQSVTSETKPFNASIQSQEHKIIENEVTYIDLNSQLERINISYDTTVSSFELESSLEAPADALSEIEPSDSGVKEQNGVKTEDPLSEDNVCPSAPVFDEVLTHQQMPNVDETVEASVWQNKPKVQCMPLAEAARLFAGAEISKVKEMSEREEAIVEAGPMCGPEHPLVDLLSNFRCSLIAVERERLNLARGFIEEQKSRLRLWKVEKRIIYVSEKCSCDAIVGLKATYEHAELMKSLLPVAKMRLESLLRDAQHSYCHHQHAALLAHCQIEELIADTIQTSKNNIREALSLILKELRMSDSGPSVLSEALQRWARALSAALVDSRDLRQLLFLVHQMCRQTRSVGWVSSLIHLSAGDSIEVARAIALLDLVMCGSRVDPALECTEETDEVWEEVDKRGASGAVADGALREKDLLALFQAFPLTDIVARLALFRHRDITLANEYEWGDGSGGRGVLKSACGTRVLLASLQRAVVAHPHYERLARAVVKLALHAVCALADLHLHTRDCYFKELEASIQAELEATFSDTFRLLSAARAPLSKLPFRMLENNTAMLYCVPFMVMLHETETKSIEGADVELREDVTCEARVRLLAHASVDRTDDLDLARNVLEYLFELGLKSKATPCKGGCEAAARESLPKLLAAHPYLYTTAYHSLVDLCQAENTDPSMVTHLSPELWRPTPQEAIQVLSECCSAPSLLPAILRRVDCTPHVGLPLETQLAIGSWLTIYCRNITDTPEWPWTILRRLRLHRAWWNMPYDAPPPDNETGLLQDAYNVLATSWGHCLPLICECGVKALHRLAQAGRLRDVTHCLSAILIVMTQSPESVSFTPKFGEVFSSLLGSGPNLLQRALGRGGDSGSNLLLKLMLAHLTDTWKMINIPLPTLLSVWLHSLWKGGCPLLEVGMLACRQWQHLDRHAALALQEENSKELTSNILRTSSQHPTVACAVLRALHAAHEAAGVWARLLHALHCQLLAKQGIHVDNALKTIGASITSEELVIHKLAAAALVAPLSNPSHLALWNMFFCLYLQRPPTDMRETTPPVGPLIFSGFIKSRVLNQLKKRLLETATYHYNESTRLKSEQKQAPSENPSKTISKSEPVDSKSSKVDTDLLPPLSLTDLTGEAKALSESSGSDTDKVEEEREDNGETGDKQLQDLIMYHVVAESIIRSYIGWLEEGDKVRALPHNLRHIPEPALAAACQAEVSRLMPPSSPDDEDLAPFPKGIVRVAAPIKSPFQRAVDRLTKYRPKARRRHRRTSLKSPLEDMNLSNPRALLSLVDKHLRDIERLAREWESEVSRLSKLDSALWELVASLRVRRSVAPVKKSCPNNCSPLTLVLPCEEWCISTGAERGLQENRASAGAALRKLARPRPAAARTAAALQTITRQVRSPEIASSVLDRAWRCSGDKDAEDCAPARLVLTNIVTDLAEKWITHDGARCADFLRRWCTSSKDLSPLKQSLAGTLLSPRRLPPSDWTTVYTTLLNVDIPAHAAFSYLSKFEINRWSEVATPEQRHAALEALTIAAQRHGSKPDEEFHILLELIGVHTATLVDARELSHVVLWCARASADNKLPATHWTHAQRAVQACGESVSSDQLGHTLRELGVIWWGARAHASRDYTPYAPHIAKLLRLLIFAFVTALQNQHYATERVSWFAWSALIEAWSPWVQPCADRAPLLPPAGDVDTFVLQQFCRDISGLIHGCPGSEPYVLQEAWEWTSQLLPTSSPRWSLEHRVQLASLLAELGNLPWTQHQWFTCRCMQSLLKLCTSGDHEAQSWACTVLRHTAAATWLHAVPDEHLAPHLATLFYLFTTMSLHEETLEEATKLPWWRLPSAALEPALERFFAEHHSIATAYHTLPQFRIVLFASELSIHPAINVYFTRPAAADKRLSAISLWVRAMSAPTLQGHVADATVKLLDVVTKIASSLSSTEGEVEGLLSRAVTILCTEPAGTTSLPVWEKWVSSAPPAVVKSCLSAVATLTVFEHYASLADATVQAHLLATESTGWSEVSQRWREGHWRDAHSLAARGRLHAAYATSVAHAQSHCGVRTALLALPALTLNFEESETILALWICYTCRVAWRTGREATDVGEDCVAAAESLLHAWSETKRRSLLKAITLQGNADQPTHRLRLLCLFAQCVLSPESEAAVRGFEACLLAALGSSPGDVAAWGAAPHPRRLPRLAIRLFPKYEKYFQLEYDLTPEET